MHLSKGFPNPVDKYIKSLVPVSWYVPPDSLEPRMLTVHQNYSLLIRFLFCIFFLIYFFISFMNTSFAVYKYLQGKSIGLCYYLRILHSFFIVSLSPIDRIRNRILPLQNRTPFFYSILFNDSTISIFFNLKYITQLISTEKSIVNNELQI